FWENFGRRGQVSRAHCSGQVDSRKRCRGRAMKERFSIDRADFSGPVLVTGAGGCIGSWVLALLVRAGVPACALDLSEDKRRPRLLLAESDVQKIAWRTGDISESKTVVQVFEAVRPCAVIHLAALQVPFCKADPVAGAKVNVVGTVNVFEAARTSTGQPLAFPMHLPDEPLRAQLGNYGNMPLDEGIRETYEAFRSLIGRGLVSMPESA